MKKTSEVFQILIKYWPILSFKPIDNNHEDFGSLI